VKRRIYVISALLAGLILLVATKTVLHNASFRLGAQPPPGIDPVEEPSGSPGPGKAVGPGDLRATVEKDIFRTDTSGATPDLPVEGAPVMPTELTLSLKGTVVGYGKKSFAIISEPGTGKQGLYGVGDRIQEARVTEIHPDRVLLTVKGTKKALYIETSTPDPASVEGRNVPGARRAEVTSPERTHRRPGADLRNVGAKWTR
jgi:type II secretory pathway component PulC